MLAHLIQREQALFLDRPDDHALAHAVAAAHLHGVGHLRGIVLPLVAGVAEVRLPEHQMVAYPGHVLFVAQHLKIPAAVAGVAHHHAADDTIILQHDFFVHAADGVVQQDFFRVGGTLKVAGFLRCIVTASVAGKTYRNLATAGFVGFQTLNVLDENLVSLQFGQFNSYRGLAMLNLLKPSQQNESQHAYVAGEYYTSDGYFDSPQDFKRLSLFGKYSGSLGQGNYLSATISTFNSQWDASGQIPLRAIESGMIGFFGAIDSTEGGKTSRSNVNLQLSSTLNQNSWIKNQVFYSRYDFELYSNFTFFLEDSINGDQIRQKEDRNMFGYNGSYQRDDRFLNLGWQTELGLQYRQDLSNDNELSHTVDKTTTLEQLAYGDVNESNIGVFLNETVRISDWLTINAGLRFDHFIFSYKDQLTNLEGKSVSDQIMSPKLNTYVRLSDKLQVFSSVGYGFHSNDTRVVITQPDAETLPRALGIDIGTVWKPIPRLLLTGTLWHLDLEQEFVYVGDAAIVEPSGRTERMGIEFSGRWQVLDWLYADIDMNLTKATSVHEPTNANYIPLAPRFSSIGGLTVQTKNNWSGSIRYRTLGDRPANEYNSVIAEGYTVIDALVTYRIKRYEFGINIDNVFDVRWREAQFDTESRLRNEVEPVSEIHFTPGTPFALRAHVSYHF